MSVLKDIKMKRVVKPASKEKNYIRMMKIEALLLTFFTLRHVHVQLSLVSFRFMSWNLEDGT